MFFGYVEPGYVLACDISIGANVYDIDSLDIVPEMIDCLSDNAACHQRLSQTDLVRDQETPCVVLVCIQAAECVINRAQLKILQRFEGPGGVRSAMAGAVHELISGLRSISASMPP